MRSGELTGGPWNLKPLNHLLPLGVVQGGRALLGYNRQLRDSKQSNDPVAAQRLGEGDEGGSAGDLPPQASRHLGEGSKVRSDPHWDLHHGSDWVIRASKVFLAGLNILSEYISGTYMYLYMCEKKLLSLVCFVLVLLSTCCVLKLV